MSYMDRMSTCFFLFLILTLPYFSRAGGSRLEALDSEMYEIDYRGPETHSSVPPPGKPHSPHQKSSAGVAKAIIQKDLLHISYLQ